MLKAQPVEQWNSGIPLKIPIRAGPAGYGKKKNKSKAAEESVQVEDQKIAELEDQIRKERYRKGLCVKSADEQKRNRKMLQELKPQAAGVATNTEIQWNRNRFGEGKRKKNVRRARGGSQDGPEGGKLASVSSMARHDQETSSHFVACVLPGLVRTGSLLSFKLERWDKVHIGLA